MNRHERLQWTKGVERLHAGAEEARVEKCMQQILHGKGLNDQQIPAWWLEGNHARLAIL
ncbi:MAG: hypothetical protein H7258_13580 [Ferruginibacter sp.]|nr:hypothetical protein [Ferruginibacter sp.]